MMISKQDVFVTSATQNTDLGAQATTGDGRYFRYCYVAGGATTLVPGTLVQSAAQSTSNYQKLGVSVAGAVGATTVTIGSSVTIVANALSGGLLTVASGTGIGYTYKILSNTGVSSAAGCVITLEDPIVVAFTTSAVVNLQPNPYSGIIINPTTQTGTPLGVAVSPVAGSSYGWIQTKGAVSALSDSSAPAVGLAVAASPLTAGAFGVASGTTAGYAQIGTSMQTQTSAQNGFIYLDLD